jgi:hypothetical protein
LNDPAHHPGWETQLFWEVKPAAEIVVAEVTVIVAAAETARVLVEVGSKDALHALQIEFSRAEKSDSCHSRHSVLVKLPSQLWALGLQSTCHRQD